jgi:N4-(beta-N-acetylglucosaminyl)-L-asparaginase
MPISRRTFLGAAAAGLALPRAPGAFSLLDRSVRASDARRGRPIVVSSANGFTKDAEGKQGIQVAADLLSQGADPLDAVLAGVGIVELNPNDQSVGLGGLPNEDGVVQLDASCMHGPTKRAGAVGALEDIATASLVAKAVMDHTDHIFLVGAGAKRFALELGFKEQNLLTEQSRQDWLRWKESLNPYDNWLDPAPRVPPTGARETPPSHDRGANSHVGVNAQGVPFTDGTINMLAVTATGDVASVTTTSGLSWKIPGRVGDSPIVGAGQYCDNEVGAAGSTGRGEACMKVCGAFLAVEFMRQGMSPEQALLRVIERAIAMTEKRLLDETGRPYFDLEFFAVNKKGEYAGARTYEGGQFAVCDALGTRLEKAVYLYPADQRPKGRPISGTMRRP